MITPKCRNVYPRVCTPYLRREILSNGGKREVQECTADSMPLRSISQTRRGQEGMQERRSPVEKEIASFFGNIKSITFIAYYFILCFIIAKYKNLFEHMFKYIYTELMPSGNIESS